MNVTVFDGDFCTHRLQAFDVLIDGTRTNRTTARQRHPCFAKTRQQRAQYQNRRTHGFYQIISRFGADRTISMYRDFVVFEFRDRHAQLTQQLNGRANVTQVRHVTQLNRFTGE